MGGHLFTLESHTQARWPKLSWLSQDTQPGVNNALAERGVLNAAVRASSISAFWGLTPHQQLQYATTHFLKQQKSLNKLKINKKRGRSPVVAAYTDALR
jgi:hypothetical protein